MRSGAWIRKANKVRVGVCTCATVCLALAAPIHAASVTTRDGKSYEGEVVLQTGNSVAVAMGDSKRVTIPLSSVRAATFTSAQLSMAQFSGIADGWTNIDIGDVSIAGIAGQSNRLFAIQVASADIGGHSDSLHFAYFRTSGDADLTARVLSIGGADRLARAGLMIRDSLKPDGKQVFAGVNAAGQMSLIHRAKSGDKAIAAEKAPVTFPCWLKLSRREKIFTVYGSKDGRHWDQIGAMSVEMKEPVYFTGLAVTSHSGFSFCTAQLDEVTRTVSGVNAEYFADRDFIKLTTNRVDPFVNFHWVGEPPAAGLRFNHFSVRWTGELEPKYSEPYTFYFDAEDAKLQVNGEQIPHIPLRREARDKNAPPPPTATPLLLKAGNRYPFKFEYRHTGWVRNPVRLGWSSTSQGREIIPSQRLFCTVDAVARSGTQLKKSAEWVMGRGVMLRNGTFIAGHIRSVSEAGVKFVYRDEAEYSAPLHQVSRAVFRVSPRNKTLGDRGLPEGALLGNGDFLEGTIQLGSGRSVKVSSVLLGLRSFSLDGNDLAALALNDPTPVATPYEVRLADNSVIMAKTIDVQQEDVSIVEPIVGTLRVPREVVVEIRAGGQPGMASAERTKSDGR